MSADGFIGRLVLCRAWPLHLRRKIACACAVSFRWLRLSFVDRDLIVPRLSAGASRPGDSDVGRWLYWPIGSLSRLAPPPAPKDRMRLCGQLSLALPLIRGS